jgi:hypothetical protein
VTVEGDDTVSWFDEDRMLANDIGSLLRTGRFASGETGLGSTAGRSSEVPLVMVMLGEWNSFTGECTSDPCRLRGCACDTGLLSYGADKLGATSWPEYDLWYGLEVCAWKGGAGPALGGKDIFEVIMGDANAGGRPYGGLWASDGGANGGGLRWLA